MALLLSPKGFQIYLHVQEPLPPRGVADMGVEHLVRSTDNESDRERIKERLQAYDAAVYLHADAATGRTFLHGSGPDGERIIVTLSQPTRTAAHGHRGAATRLTYGVSATDASAVYTRNVRVSCR
jgi:hypothetical protein